MCLRSCCNYHDHICCCRWWCYSFTSQKRDTVWYSKGRWVWTFIKLGPTAPAFIVSTLYQTSMAIEHHPCAVIFSCFWPDRTYKILQPRVIFDCRLARMVFGLALSSWFCGSVLPEAYLPFEWFTKQLRWRCNRCVLNQRRINELSVERRLLQHCFCLVYKYYRSYQIITYIIYIMYHHMSYTYPYPRWTLKISLVMHFRCEREASWVFFPLWTSNPVFSLLP